MKKAILSVVTICAVAVFLVGQDSATKSTSRPSSRSASSKPASRAVVKTDPAAKYKIAMKYQPGVKYEITTRMEDDSTYSSGPNGETRKYKSSLTVKSYLDMPKPAADGTIAAKMMVGRIIAIRKSGDDEERTIDTDKLDEIEDGRSAREITSVVEPEYTIYFDKNGDIEKVDGIEELIVKMSGGKAMNQSSIDHHKNEMSKVVESFVSSPLVYGNCQFGDVGQECQSIISETPFMFGDKGKGGEEELKLKLAAIEDSPAGKIAVIDVEGTITMGNNSVVRTGQIRFNLDKNILESMRLEFLNERGNSKDHLKSEVEVKIVDKIPARVASQPAGNPPADSQPAK